MTTLCETSQQLPISLDKPKLVKTPLKTDKDELALFTNVHQSKAFTVEAAYKAFAGIKREK